MTVRLLRLTAWGCLLGAFLVACSRSNNSGQSGKQASVPKAVQTVAVQPRPLQRTLVVNGTLAAQERSTLSAKVPGRLQDLKVDIGSAVHRGQLLAQIEKRDYELRLQQAAAALAQTRAALGLSTDGDDDKIDVKQVASVKQALAVLEEATKNRQRIKDLSGSGIASRSELDTVEATYTVALARHEAAIQEAQTRIAALAERRAEFEISKKQLADTAIIAPFDGTVQTRPASLGEYLAAGAPVLQMVQSDPLRLRLEVPERQSTLVRTGQVVRLLLEGADTNHTSVIARISPALDERTRMLVVEADIPSRGALRAGLFARAEIVVSEQEPGLCVPPEALTTFAGVEKVVGIENGQAREKNVVTGRRGDGWVEIVSGVRSGELLVLNPAGLRTGQPLEAVHPTATQAALPASPNDAKTR